MQISNDRFKRSRAWLKGLPRAHLVFAVATETLSLNLRFISNEIELKQVNIQTTFINKLKLCKNNYLAAALITRPMINLEKLVTCSELTYLASTDRANKKLIFIMLVGCCGAYSRVFATPKNLLEGSRNKGNIHAK